MNFRLSLTQIWGVLSRTRPCAPLPRQRPLRSPPRGIWGTFGGGFWYFIYQSIGVTAPFGLCYVVGVVVGGIGGEGITAAILIAMVASLLTGLCYSDLISNRQCSGNASTAIYQLVGELPAYCAAYLNVVISCTCFAAMSKALSSTMDELSHERLNKFLSDIFGNLPLSEVPPDILAFGAALVTSVLLACGLKQAGALRTAMNIFSLVGLAFFLSVGGGHTRSSTLKIEPGSRQIVAGAGVCCCLFSQYLELGRRSKAQFKANLKLPVAIAITSVLVLLISLGLGFVLYSMMDDRPLVSGAPLLRSLQLRDVDWARLIMGSIQVIIISLGISESGESACRHLVGMASDGFIPSIISLECPLAFSHSRAHLVGGVAASISALLFTHVYILEFMATNILLLNILVILATVYHPFRCMYDSLCSVAVTTSSKRAPKLSPSSRLRPNMTSSKTNNSTRTIHFLKNGIRILTFPQSGIELRSSQEEDELSIPLLSPGDTLEIPKEEASSSFSEQGINNSFQPKQESVLHMGNAHKGKDGKKGKSFYSPTKGGDILDEDSNDSELVCLNDSSNSSEESGEEQIQELEEFMPEEDIDAIVSEYKEKHRVSSVSGSTNSLPTKYTARRAFLCILGFVITSIALSVFSLNVKASMSAKPKINSALRTIFVLGCLMVIFGILVILSQLPITKSSTSTERSFRIICSTWVSFIALFLNILLATELFSRTIWTVLPLHASAVVWYAAYSSRHSIVAMSQQSGGLKLHSTDRKENEMVCLSPTVPAPVYATRPQREGLNQNI